MTVDEMIIWLMKLLAAEDAPDSERCARMFDRIFREVRENEQS